MSKSLFSCSSNSCSKNIFFVYGSLTLSCKNYKAYLLAFKGHKNFWDGEVKDLTCSLLFYIIINNDKKIYYRFNTFAKYINNG